MSVSLLEVQLDAFSDFHGGFAFQLGLLKHKEVRHPV